MILVQVGGTYWPLHSATNKEFLRIKTANHTQVMLVLVMFVLVVLVLVMFVLVMLMLVMLVMVVLVVAVLVMLMVGSPGVAADDEKESK